MMFSYFLNDDGYLYTYINLINLMNFQLLNQDSENFRSMKMFEQSIGKSPKQSIANIAVSTVLSEVEARRQKKTDFKRKLSSGVVADTFDSLHLDKFINQSLYTTSNVMRKKDYSSRANEDNKDCEHYFRTTLQNKNTSHIGYTNTNPLIASLNLQNAIKMKEAIQSAIDNRSPTKIKYTKYQGNEIKFQITNPLTFQNVGKQKQKHQGYKKKRLENLIQKRYPHGLLFHDNPENNTSRLYHSENKTKPDRIREQPNAHASFLIDREWKSKKHIEQPGHLIDNSSHSFNIRRFANTSRYGYNILNNNVL